MHERPEKCVKIFGRMSEGKRPLGRYILINWRILLKYILVYGVRVWTGCICLMVVSSGAFL